MEDEFVPVLRKVDLVIAEAAELARRGPHFRIIHRFWQPGTICTPGEEVAAVLLAYHSREYVVQLSLALRLLFDYLARHSRFPQSAAQVEAGIRADAFYANNAAAVMGRRRFTRRISRSAIKVYVQRLRSAIEDAFYEAGMRMESRRVLISQSTVTKEVGYKLEAKVEWLHE